MALLVVAVVQDLYVGSQHRWTKRVDIGGELVETDALHIGPDLALARVVEQILDQSLGITRVLDGATVEAALDLLVARTAHPNWSQV